MRTVRTSRRLASADFYGRLALRLGRALLAGDGGSLGAACPAALRGGYRGALVTPVRLGCSSRLPAFAPNPALKRGAAR